MATKRIKEADLYNRLDRLNRGLNFEKPYYGKMGAYGIDSAYGGHKLVQYIKDDSGTIKTITGFCTKSELFSKMGIYMDGLGDGIKFKKEGNVITPYPETHFHGSISFEQDIISGHKDGEISVHIAEDGRIWINVNGGAVIRFKPKVKEIINGK